LGGSALLSQVRPILAFLGDLVASDAANLVTEFQEFRIIECYPIGVTLSGDSDPRPSVDFNGPHPRELL
jgi:hypothetical protein